MSDWYIPPLTALLPDVQWKSPNESICLTFDDGPHPTATPKVLQILREEGIRATFFLIGENADKYPDIVARVIADGHQIGNHTLTHRKIVFAEESVIREEVDRCQEILGKVAGAPPHIFRPPYGLFDLSTSSRMERRHLRIVMFSVNAWDFSDRSAERISDRVTRSAATGDIVVFHDNPHTAPLIDSYLPRVIQTLRKKGHSFGLV